MGKIRRRGPPPLSRTVEENLSLMQRLARSNVNNEEILKCVGSEEEHSEALKSLRIGRMRFISARKQIERKIGPWCEA